MVWRDKQFRWWWTQMDVEVEMQQRQLVLAVNTKRIVFLKLPVAETPWKERQARQNKPLKWLCFSSSSPDLMQICLWTMSFGWRVSSACLKLVRLLLLPPGRTPFQQDESGVIDLAGGWMAGSMLTYCSVSAWKTFYLDSLVVLVRACQWVYVRVQV